MVCLWMSSKDCINIRERQPKFRITFTHYSIRRVININSTMVYCLNFSLACVCSVTLWQPTYTCTHVHTHTHTHVHTHTHTHTRTSSASTCAACLQYLPGMETSFLSHLTWPIEYKFMTSIGEEMRESARMSTTLCKSRHEYKWGVHVGKSQSGSRCPTEIPHTRTLVSYMERNLTFIYLYVFFCIYIHFFLDFETSVL